MTERLSKLRIPFVHCPPPSIAERKANLRKLKDLIESNEERFCEALYADERRPRHECITLEVLPLTHEIGYMLQNIDEWAGEQVLSRTLISLMDTASVTPQPYGLALIMGAWNYPVFLTFMPVVGALAAGNAVVIKPSEMAPACEALIAELVPKYFDESVCQVFTGGVDETVKLLDTQKFDYIFYTGGPNAARSILRQAAKFLTPVTLELGGKSPVFVDKSADLGLLAKRLIWGKCMNSGQTCVSPDYLLCHPDLVDGIIEAFTTVLKQFYGEDMATSKEFARIINERHTERLAKLIKETKGKIVFGGRSDVADKFVEVTIVRDVTKDDILMQEEIFGPILPIMAVDSVQEAIDYVNSREKPLALYVFTSDKNVKNEWKEKTSSGSLVFNETVMQLGVPNLPFGGAGNSGMGRYKGRASLETFSNPRSVLDRTTSEQAHNLFRYPPYRESQESWARWALTKNEGSSCCTC